VSAVVAVRERPILFSGEMVRAILGGRKTQTRRVVKPKPDSRVEAVRDVPSQNHYWPATVTRAENWTDYHRIADHNPESWVCPYGQPGDHLYVREAHYVWSAGYSDGSGRDIRYRATDPDSPNSWTPSIHMPRWASRLTLEITEVRVEKLQDMSKEDAIMEGATQRDAGWSMDWSRVGTLSNFAEGGLMGGREQRPFVRARRFPW